VGRKAKRTREKSAALVRRYEAWLREDFPVDVPIRVRFRRLRNLNGFCEPRRQGLLIGIDRKALLHQDFAVGILLHEWAHARVHRRRGKHHARAWALEYGRIESAWSDDGAFKRWWRRFRGRTLQG
jgi:hypothetical protein